MKKTLVAIAALASLVSVAQAQSSMVLYGVLDAGVRNDSNVAKASTGAAQSLTQFNNGALNTSRFGIRGTQDVADGIKANFKLESGLKPGNGASSNATNLFDRTASVGLQNSLGSLDLGRVTTFAYDTTASYTIDPLGLEMTNNNQVAGVKAININPLGTAIGSGFFTSRRDNSMKYMGTFGPVSAGFAYSFGNVSGNSTAGSSAQVMAKYSANGLNLAATTDSLTDATSLKQTLTTFGGNYTISGVKLTAGTVQLKTPAGYTAVAGVLSGSTYAGPSTFLVGAAATAETKMSVNDIGLTYQVTSDVNLAVAYYTAKFEQNALSNTFNTYAARVRYAVGKTTDIYGEVDNTKATGMDVSKSAAASLSNSGYTIGLQHRF
ncbi:MAG: porin [Betaproteobacteria bacterium]